jgi:chemotaxis protein MotB
MSQRSRAAARVSHDRYASHDRWLVSYADFITLLFGFFVVMYAFAKADAKKHQQVELAIRQAFQTLGMGPADVQGSGPQTDGSWAEAVVHEQLLSPTQVRDDLARIQRELTRSLAPELQDRSVSIQMSRDGLVISLREAGFFNSGSATPKPETVPALHKIAASLGQSAYDLRVEGHTDNVPIHNADFDSNWELSTARATGIARLLLALNAVPAERLSAAGYAEFHPVASNATAEGRAQNRRVDIVVMPRTQIDFATQPATHAKGPWRRITDGDK